MKRTLSTSSSKDGSATQKPLNFNALHDAFVKVLDEAFAKRDAKLLRQAYDSYTANTDHDKKSPMDHAFRELLLFKLKDDVEGIGALLRLSADAVRLEIVSVTIPVVLLGDIFEVVPLDKCERIFGFVEDMVEVWKEEVFFTSCKNNILRMCNDLLRRLSRAQNTVFCGRILLFLSKFFPFSERSGLNIVSEFNLDNVTEYGVDGKDMDDTLEDTVEDVPIKIDYNLYCKFWSLQDFFRNPNQCYSKAQWKMFQVHAGTVLEAFASFKLEETGSSSANDETGNDEDDVVDASKMDVDEGEASAEAAKQALITNDQNLCKTGHFFAKFLTNPKLLALQLSDSNFRRSVLVQFLILFQYLQLTVKFKSDSNTLTTAQTEFIKDTEAKVYQLLEEIPPHGKRFSRTVQHMLAREEMWNNWKNEGCKEFRKPDDIEAASAGLKDDGDEPAKPPPEKRIKRTLGDSLKEATRQGKFFLGNDALTRLWNYSPDNLQACKSEERNFLPQIDTFLENMPDKSDPPFEWRALRLLARQSPHFFTFLNSSSYKICEYLESVRRKLVRDKLDIEQKAQHTLDNAAESTENGTSHENAGEHDHMAFQEPDGEQEADADLDEDQAGGEPTGDDDKNDHVAEVTATREQIEEISPLIGGDWKKLGRKLGFTADELLYFETEYPGEHAACNTMLTNWFADDDDASLDNLAYIMEGLEIKEAANAIKALLERANSEATIEVLSD